MAYVAVHLKLHLPNFKSKNVRRILQTLLSSLGFATFFLVVFGFAVFAKEAPKICVTLTLKLYILLAIIQEHAKVKV